MSATLLLLCGAAYLWVAYGYLNDGRYGMAVAFVSYAIANLGFAIDTWM